MAAGTGTPVKAASSTAWNNGTYKHFAARAGYKPRRMVQNLSALPEREVRVSLVNDRRRR
ncbi:hypothetical protein E4U31_000784 [Claviceps sp. LM219 group G6]|nr:hypothetical protein E4U31_000784 [Claviceps sp. LM219 group G6]